MELVKCIGHYVKWLMIKLYENIYYVNIEFRIERSTPEHKLCKFLVSQ